MNSNLLTTIEVFDVNLFDVGESYLVKMKYDKRYKKCLLTSASRTQLQFIFVSVEKGVESLKVKIEDADDYEIEIH